MDIQENGSSPDSPPIQAEESLENITHSMLITRLRIAIKMEDFDKVEKILETKENRLKIQKDALLKKIELEMLETKRISNELKICKEELKKSNEQREEYKALAEKGRRAQEIHEKLLEEGNKDTLEKNTMAELRLEICKVKDEKHCVELMLESERVMFESMLKDEKCKHELELDDWKSMFEELSERVSQLEKCAKCLPEECNDGGYTVWESRANKKAIEVNSPRGGSENNSSEYSPSQTNTHFTSGADTMELERNLNNVVLCESGGGNMGMETANTSGIGTYTFDLNELPSLPDG